MVLVRLTVSPDPGGEPRLQLLGLVHRVLGLGPTQSSVRRGRLGQQHQKQGGAGEDKKPWFFPVQISSARLLPAKQAYERGAPGLETGGADGVNGNQRARHQAQQSYPVDAGGTKVFQKGSPVGGEGCRRPGNLILLTMKLWLN